MNAHDAVFNLTALADRLRSDGAVGVLPVLEHDTISAVILRPVPGQPFEDGPAPSDTIYVVIAGDGRLSSGGADEVEATSGDVLFVPAGQARRFTKLSRKFQMWRLALRPAAT